MENPKNDLEITGKIPGRRKHGFYQKIFISGSVTINNYYQIKSFALARPPLLGLSAHGVIKPIRVVEVSRASAANRSASKELPVSGTRTAKFVASIEYPPADPVVLDRGLSISLPVSVELGASSPAQNSRSLSGFVTDTSRSLGRSPEVPSGGKKAVPESTLMAPPEHKQNEVVESKDPAAGPSGFSWSSLVDLSRFPLITDIARYQEIQEWLRSSVFLPPHTPQKSNEVSAIFFGPGPAFHRYGRALTPATIQEIQRFQSTITDILSEPAVEGEDIAVEKPVQRPQTIPLELQGKWIVWSLDNLRIVGSGDTAKEAAASAKEPFGYHQKVPVFRRKG